MGHPVLSLPTVDTGRLGWGTCFFYPLSPNPYPLGCHVSSSLFPHLPCPPHTFLVQSADPNLRLLNSFLDYLKVEKGLAPLSVSAYRSDLEQYSEFLLKRKRGLKDARRQDVRDFLNSLFANGVDGRSVARKLSALRHFYKYLLLDRYITADPDAEHRFAAAVEGVAEVAGGR